MSQSKLTHGEQVQILQWLAEDWGYQYIANLVKETFNKEVSRQLIFQYSKQYQKEISEIRQKINSNISNIPIANKEVRQQRRERIFNMYMVKDEPEKAREVLKEAQAEMETKVPFIHVQQNNNDVTIFKDLPQEKTEEIDDVFRAIIERSHAGSVRPVEPALQDNQG